MLQSAGISDTIQRDRYLYPHFRHYLREIRVVAYSQFLESYKSVTLEAMARNFGVGVDFLDKWVHLGLLYQVVTYFYLQGPWFFFPVLSIVMSWHVCFVILLTGSFLCSSWLVAWTASWTKWRVWSRQTALILRMHCTRKLWSMEIYYWIGSNVYPKSLMCRWHGKP